MGIPSQLLIVIPNIGTLHSTIEVLRTLWVSPFFKVVATQLSSSEMKQLRQAFTAIDT